MGQGLLQGDDELPTLGQLGQAVKLELSTQTSVQEISDIEAHRVEPWFATARVGRAGRPL